MRFSYGCEYFHAPWDTIVYIIIRFNRPLKLNKRIFLLRDNLDG